MTARLNDELQKEVDAHGGQPLLVEHPAMRKMYVIVDQETHERAMQALRERRDDLQAIQEGIDAMEAGRMIPLAEADKRIRQEFGFRPSGK